MLLVLMVVKMTFQTFVQHHIHLQLYMQFLVKMLTDL